MRKPENIKQTKKPSLQLRSITVRPLAASNLPDVRGGCGTCQTKDWTADSEG